MAAAPGLVCSLLRQLHRVDCVPFLNCAANNTIAVRFWKRPLPTLSSGIKLGFSHYSTAPLITKTDDPDTLYKKVCVLVKGHDKMVLDSYEYFATLAAKELNITVDKVNEPTRKIDRLTLLKSIHIFKKHRVQYEMRTHYRCIELKHLTGSTADVYLEYIQRNLPEGVAMEVTKTMLKKLPDHLREPIWNSDSPQDEEKPV
ncbi:28S ribosomal protein S10, mitochondrial [Amblyraja radiata]|uniref:28S ribosomal protein S10, mitochondrial n=1 Tax=Amblyraja radiata TaxID=386614 RepID=UPI00140390EB|nr:28S ribosomal protein S10, mitochondrial [Amblyraja radiata]